MKTTLFIFSFALLTSCYNEQTEKHELKGKPLPMFNLLLADSVTDFNTNNIPMGKPVILFYFGPNCPYSKAQIEELLEDKNIIQSVRLYIFTAFPYSEMKKFYTHYQLHKYPNIITGIDYKLFFRNYFETSGVPYLAIYDKDKHLKKTFNNLTSNQQIKRIIKN